MLRKLKVVVIGHAADYKSLKDSQDRLVVSALICDYFRLLTNKS